MRAGGLRFQIEARAVANAAGPWVSQFVREISPVHASRVVRLVKGSHIVVRRLFAHRFSYIFQHADRRIVFAIPYERDFTLIGTTDVDYRGDPKSVHIDADEIAYLCAIVNRYFARSTAPADVVWSYSGVRPLLSDQSSEPASVTRDYELELKRNPALLLSVLGGKITTYRKLAESAADILAAELGSSAPAWTRAAKLPGGDLPAGSVSGFLRDVRHRYPWLPTAVCRRYVQAYGTRIDRVIGDARTLADMGDEVRISVEGLIIRCKRLLLTGSKIEDLVYCVRLPLIDVGYPKEQRLVRRRRVCHCNFNVRRIAHLVPSLVRMEGNGYAIRGDLEGLRRSRQHFTVARPHAAEEHVLTGYEACGNRRR